MPNILIGNLKRRTFAETPRPTIPRQRPSWGTSMGLKKLPSFLDWWTEFTLQMSLHAYQDMTAVFMVVVAVLLETCGFKAFPTVW